MKKILHITTLSRTINAFLVPHITALVDEGNIVDCACCIDKDREIPIELQNRNVSFFDVPFSRNPLAPSNLKAFKQLVDIQKKNKYDIVHVHTPVASVYGRLLKIRFPNIKTIYTAHGFHFYKGAPLLNWIIYYPIEKIMARFTDIMITINSEDYERAKTFKVKETYKVNGVGVDLDKYSLENFDRSVIRETFDLKDDDFVILMIAEVNKNKNHKQMIDAIEILKNKGIENIKVICAGDGVIFDEVSDDIKERNLQDNIRMLGFRTDINELIVACDMGILMSYREGLPRNIMELMACGKPVIGTDIRGIRDLVEDNINGYLVSVGDSQTTADKIESMYRKEEVLKNMSYNSIKAIKKYSIDKVVDQLGMIYYTKDFTMRCLHVLPMNKLSGAEKLALILCKNIKKYKPIIVCGGDDLKSIFENEGIESYSIDFTNNNIIKSSKELKRIVKEHNIKIIHAHDNKASVTSYIAKKLYNLDVNVISHIHNCYPWLEGHTKTKKIDTFFRKRYDHNIACGKLVYDYYTKNTDYINEKNTTILSNAIDIDEIKKHANQNLGDVYSEFNIPKGKTIFGFIGRLAEQKGIIPFIKELSNYKDKFMDCIFLLVGNGEQEAEIRQLIKELQLEELFILTRYQDNVYRFYPIIDIFFLPSLYEGLPMVILEAMSFGKPVVSMDVGSINEVIINNKSGVLIDKGNYKEFIQNIISVNGNKELANKYGKEALKEIDKNYNVKNYEKNISKLYDKILNAK